MRHLAVALAASALLTSCATPEARLRAGLMNAGLPEPMARCMAGRMVDRLSLMQLRRISDLPRARESLSIEEFLHRVRALRDSQIWGAASASAAICAVAAG
ncbi:MAG TPA: hypothetical protein VEW04_07505 [Allosphingosinicella sp.]|nr:hypothetical protein [Allosphingosinicella sp.]